jgi:hypothetical protein
LVAQELLEVFYAPHRAFKKIVQNPKFLGPLLILVIFVVVQVGSAYVVASKSYLEQTMPTGDQGDTWTENAALWQASSGVTVMDNHVDYINSSVLYYNTTSIEFTADNASSVQMFLNDLGGSVNCGADGFKNLSLRVKIVSPDAIPRNVTLYLYSLSPAINFAYDLTGAFSNSSANVWSNITVPVGSGNWRSSGSAATWDNITGLKMDFAWTSSSKIDLRVDGLFFRGIYKGSLDVYGSSVLISSALNSVTPFLFQWLLLTALIYLLIKGLKGNVVWKPVMVAVGFALVTLVVQSLIMLAAYTTLSNVNYPLEILANIPGESTVAYQTVQDTIGQVLLVGSTVQVAVWVWIFALGTCTTRAVTSVVPASPLVSTQAEGEGVTGFPQFGWLKCMLVSVASLAITITILGFLGIS